MKSLSIFCLLLWLIPYFGKQYFLELFSTWYIQWTSFGLLNVLLPFGFAKSISIQKEQKYATSFLFIFLANVYLIGTGLNLLKSTNTYLTVQSASVPENASLAAINNEKPEVRNVIAQVIYKEFGQPIMYKNESNELVIYSPTEDDKKSYREKYTTGEEAKKIIKSTSWQITEVMYLFAWACGCFLIIFVITFSLEQRKPNKAIKRNY